MKTDYTIHPIAYIYNDFPNKFGIPRQSGLINSLKSMIIFEPEYRFPEALRGLEDYTHIWLIWGFSENMTSGWSPTVRPPRLGGNTRMGVFATRSPFRPNALGLSSVRLEKIEFTSEYGPILHIAGADLMNKTPIFDIKPYLNYVDSHPDASDGFAAPVKNYTLDVSCPNELLNILPENKREPLLALLAQDPRPSYQNDPKRVYGFSFAGFEIKFTVHEKRLSVISVIPG